MRTNHAPSIHLNPNLAKLFIVVAIVAVTGCIARVVSSNMATRDAIYRRNDGEFGAFTGGTPSASTMRMGGYKMEAGATYSWQSVDGGTSCYLSDDSYCYQSLPFPFKFFDKEFTGIFVCSNGILSFSNSFSNFCSIPSSEYSYFMAVFGDDLYPTKANNVYVKSTSNFWTAAWYDIPHCAGSPIVGTFQVVLFPNGSISFNYDYLSYTSNGYYTCGLNHGVNSSNFNIYKGLTTSTNDFTIRFTQITLNITNTPPVLSSPCISQPSKTPHICTFNVTYSDADNDAPLDIRLHLNTSIYTMYKAKSSDLNYKDGCVYTYNIRMPLGSSIYWFDARDLYDSTNTTCFAGPTISNTAPTLSSASVTPASASHNTLITFRITYTDTENDYPNIQVHYGSYTNIFSFQKEDYRDTDFSDGCRFYASTNIPTGNYTHWFEASDGYCTTNTSIMAGPLVTNTNPVLCLAAVSPANGTSRMSYRFTVQYVDADNDYPRYVNLQSRLTYRMEKVDSNDQNYIDGCLYYCWANFPVGSYSYSFLTSDGFASTCINGSRNVTIVAPMYKPVLSNFTCTRDSTSFIFTFKVKYSHVENVGPYPIMLYLRDGVTETQHHMSNFEYYNVSYVIGKIFHTFIDLKPYHNYSYRVVASDGLFETNSSWYQGPDVSQYAASISDFSVSISSGDTNTLFVFRIWYKDPDGHYPYSIYTMINSSYYWMSKENSQSNSQDGCYYVYKTQLPAANYSCQVICSADGLYLTTAWVSIQVKQALMSIPGMIATGILASLSVLGLIIWIIYIIKKKSKTSSSVTSIHAPSIPSSSYLTNMAASTASIMASSGPVSAVVPQTGASAFPSLGDDDLIPEVQPLPVIHQIPTRYEIPASAYLPATVIVPGFMDETVSVPDLVEDANAWITPKQVNVFVDQGEEPYSGNLVHNKDNSLAPKLNRSYVDARCLNDVTCDQGETELMFCKHCNASVAVEKSAFVMQHACPACKALLAKLVPLTEAMRRPIMKLDAVTLSTVAVLSALYDRDTFSRSGRVYIATLGKIASARTGSWKGNETLKDMIALMCRSGLVTKVTHKTVVFASWLMNFPSADAFISAVFNAFNKSRSARVQQEQLYRER